VQPEQQVQQVQASLDQQVQQARLEQQAQQAHKEQQFKLKVPLIL
jgi:hypothetical protein